MTKIIIFAMIVSSTTINNSFKENIDGDWHSFISGGWKIIQEEGKTTFIKKEKDERGENIEYPFVGKIKEGNFIDEFSFVGQAEDGFFQTEDGDFCLVSKTFKTKGRFENNKIHMFNCAMKVTTNCLSGKYNRRSLYCSGEWKVK